MIIDSVRLAFFTVGCRKIGTPLLTASTPVIAVQPLANAFKMSHSPTASVGAESGGGGWRGVGCPPARTAFAPPIAMIAASVTTKRYVGSKKVIPDSRVPRRFTIVSKKRIPRQSATV